MSQKPSLPAPRVAVVDDEEDVLTFVRIALEDAGFTVQALDRPTEAIGALEVFRPHLILLDLLMPEQMGVSLYAELRQNPVLRHVPVIILSGLNARDTLPEAAGYLEKPVDAAALLHAVRRVLPDPRGGTP